MDKTWQVSRRTMLRGLGVSLALPFLDVMVPTALFAIDDPASKALKFRPPANPVRMVLMNLPCGTIHNEWEPKSAGALGELPAILKPLQANVTDINVINNLRNNAANADGIAHYANEANFFTGTVVKKTEGSPDVGGISIDQIAAEGTGLVTRIPSLHINMQPPSGGNDSGWTRTYDNQLSWSSPTTPVPNEIDPRRCFDKLFRSQQSQSGSSGGRIVHPDEDRKSVLDYVRADAYSLKAKVGTDDQHKLDEYLTSIQDIEHQLDREFRERSKSRKINPKAELAVETMHDAIRGNDGRNHTARTRLMMDILALGLWTDSTRVATFMFGNERNDFYYDFIDGVHDSHHNTSHYTDGSDKIIQYRLINLWHVENVAYLLSRLKSLKEAQGKSVLDNSMVFFGSALSDGATHGRENLPILLAGGGGGAIKTGRMIDMPKLTPLCNLFLTMVQCLGLQNTAFADSTRTITELFQA